MTTVNNLETPSKNENKKKTPSGPLRLGALLPTLVVFTLIYGYFFFFFDHSLKRATEWIGLQIHGAEVNVASIRTSFWRGSFRLQGLEITDKNQPTRNILKISDMRFQFLWDALLRAKFVVEDAAIEGIETLSQRKYPGRVLPPEPPEKDGKSSSMKWAEDAVLNQAKSQFDGNALGDLASILGGTDPKEQLKLIQSELKSEARIKEVQKLLKDKEAQWKERIKALPNQDKINDLSARAKKVKLDTKDPAAFAQGLKEIQVLAREAEQTLKAIKEASDSAQGDVKSLESSVKDIEKWIESDLKDLQAKFKIPDLNVSDLSKGIFGRMFAQKVGSLAKYYEVAKHYMPTKSKEEKEADKLLPKERSKGKNFAFPITTGYPLFWLKRASISSKLNGSDLTGELSGSLSNVTTSPRFIKKPAVLDVKGSFPTQRITGVDLNLTLDHTGDSPRESLNFQVGSYPVSRLELSNSPDLGLNLQEATGKLGLVAVLASENLKVNLSTKFENQKFEIKAKSKFAQELVSKIVNGLPSIDVQAEAAGSIENMKWDIQSNLGRELAAGIKREVDAKIAEAKKLLKDEIDKRVGAEKEKINAQLAGFKSQLLGDLNGRKKSIDGAKSDLDKQGKTSPGKAQEKKLKEEGKKLLKKFGL